MGAKYDVDDVLFVKAKVTQVTVDETGVIYQVKMVSQEKVINQFFEEDELMDSIPSA